MQNKIKNVKQKMTTNGNLLQRIKGNHTLWNEEILCIRRFGKFEWGHVWLFWMKSMGIYDGLLRIYKNLRKRTRTNAKPTPTHITYAKPKQMHKTYANAQNLR